MVRSRAGYAGSAERQDRHAALARPPLLGLAGLRGVQRAHRPGQRRADAAHRRQRLGGGGEDRRCRAEALERGAGDRGAESRQRVQPDREDSLVRHGPSVVRSKIRATLPSVGRMSMQPSRPRSAHTRGSSRAAGISTTGNSLDSLAKNGVEEAGGLHFVQPGRRFFHKVQSARRSGEEGHGTPDRSARRRSAPFRFACRDSRAHRRPRAGDRARAARGPRGGRRAAPGRAGAGGADPRRPARAGRAGGRRGGGADRRGGGPDRGGDRGGRGPGCGRRPGDPAERVEQSAGALLAVVLPEPPGGAGR